MAAFDRITAPRNHERLIPFTTIETPNRRPAIGDVSVARSARWFVDTMELVEYTQPDGARPGSALWFKQGPFLLGEAGITVHSLGPHRARIEWFERDIRFLKLPRLTVGPSTAVVGLMTRFALWRFTRMSANLSAPRHETVQRSNR